MTELNVRLPTITTGLTNITGQNNGLVKKGTDKFEM